MRYTLTISSGLYNWQGKKFHEVAKERLFRATATVGEECHRMRSWPGRKELKRRRFFGERYFLGLNARLDPMREHQTEGKADDGCHGDKSAVLFQETSNLVHRSGAGFQNFLHIGISANEFCQWRIGFVLPNGWRRGMRPVCPRNWAAQHFCAERAEMAQPTTSQGGFDTRLLVIFLGSLAPIKADPAIGIQP